MPQWTRNMDWDKLRIFHAVAEAGSFTHAGETLNLSQSAISRHVSALEDYVQVSLFHRHARGLKLTEQGEILFEAAQQMFASLATAEDQLLDTQQTPRGSLTVTTTVGFGSTWLTPRIGKFIEEFPDINVHILLKDGDVDLGMREADVAIRMHAPTQPDLIQRKLMTVHYHSFASPDYIARHGAPKNLDDLDNHAIIVYGENAPSTIKDVNFLMRVGRDDRRQREPALRVNNIYGVLKAVESGLGIGELPDYIIPKNSSLVQVLPDVRSPEFETYFCYPSELRNSKKIQLFRDFLVNTTKEWTY